MDKENRKGNLLTAFFMVLICFVTLITASYAWFTQNTGVVLDNITINVKAKGGIQISSEAATWKTNLTNEDIKAGYPNHLNRIPETLIAVSSGGNVDTSNAYKGLLQLYAGDLVGGGLTGYNLISTRTSEYQYGTCSNSSTATYETCTGIWTNNNDLGDFIAFDIFIEATSETPLYLTRESNAIAADADAGLKNASRVAFIVEGSLENGAAALDVQRLKNGTRAIIWEPNNNVHTASAITNGTSNYGYSLGELTSTTVIGNYQGVVSEFGIGDNVPVNGNNPTYFKTITPDISTGTTHNSVKITDIPAGVTKIRVYAWIEGQDIDCENDASGSSVTYTIAFSSKPN